jgi:hypothetical protein
MRQPQIRAIDLNLIPVFEAHSLHGFAAGRGPNLS